MHSTGENSVWENHEVFKEVKLDPVVRGIEQEESVMR